MRVVGEDEFIRIESDDSRRVVIARRSARPAPGQPDLLYQKAIALLDEDEEPRDEWGLIIDVREAVGRNDADFEQALRPLRHMARARFARVVILVRSAVGQLQIERLGREDGTKLVVTRDPEQAMLLATGIEP